MQARLVDVFIKNENRTRPQKSVLTQEPDFVSHIKVKKMLCIICLRSLLLSLAIGSP